MPKKKLYVNDNNNYLFLLLLYNGYSKYTHQWSLIITERI